MKRFVWLIAVVLALLMFTCVAEAATLKATFDYDFSVDNACSATLTINCIDHFEVYDGPVLGGTKLGNVPLPTGASNVAVTGITGSFPISGYGTHTINVIAVGRDGTGSPSVQSVPATASAVVKPGSPKNLVAQ